MGMKFDMKEIEAYLDSIDNQEWSNHLKELESAQTEEELRSERINKLFAHTIKNAILIGDISADDLREALNLPQSSYSILNGCFYEIFGIDLKDA